MLKALRTGKKKIIMCPLCENFHDISLVHWNLPQHEQVLRLIHEL